jgi:5-methylcytosine-specific restriction endonuclease McrA
VTARTPRKVRVAVYERDGYQCVRCGSMHWLQPHHRRVKGMGGAKGPHVDCPCNLLTLCVACHDTVHNGARRAAEAMGYIVPRGAPAMPAETGVMRHGGDGGVTSWPACSGEWLSEGDA